MRSYCAELPVGFDYVLRFVFASCNADISFMKLRNLKYSKIMCVSMEDGSQVGACVYL